MEILSSGIWRILVKAPLTDGALQAFSWVSRVRMYKSIDHGFDAFKILQWARSRNCMKDRDRVFAILALRYSDTYPWNSFFRELEPNYTQTVADLCLHVAVGILQTGGIARLLSSVHHDWSEKMTPWTASAEPSWGPKWNEDRALNLENGHLAEYTTTLVHTIDLERGVVSTNCIIFDEVALLSPYLYMAPDNREIYSPTLWRMIMNSDRLYAFWISVCRHIGKLARHELKVAGSMSRCVMRYTGNHSSVRPALPAKRVNVTAHTSFSDPWSCKKEMKIQCSEGRRSWEPFGRVWRW
jgi:hypothetical protein